MTRTSVFAAMCVAALASSARVEAQGRPARDTITRNDRPSTPEPMIPNPRWGPRQVEGDGLKTPNANQRIVCAEKILVSNDSAKRKRDSTQAHGPNDKTANVSDRPGMDNCRDQPYAPLPATKPRNP